jgi:hypothetical protein
MTIDDLRNRIVRLEILLDEALRRIRELQLRVGPFTDDTSDECAEEAQGPEVEDPTIAPASTTFADLAALFVDKRNSPDVL